MKTYRCTKRKYRDEIAAKMALANMQRKDGSRREALEKRVYLHKKSQPGGCGFWHTTSKPYAPKTPKDYVNA